MKELFRIPMQFFAENGDGTQPAGAAAQAADGGAQDPTPAPQGDGQQKTEPAPTGKTFSQEDVDKIVAERLARQQKKFDEKMEEAAELAKMNAAQKAEHAAKKREEELVAREKSVAEKELRFTALGILEENKLPASLVDCLNLGSADACNASIEALKKAWPEAVTAAVNNALRSNTPPPYSGGNTKKDTFLQGFEEG